MKRIEDVYCIAEVSCNHGGNFFKAKRLVCEAKKAGADAVKFQYFTPDQMTINSSENGFVIRDGLWNGWKLYDLYAKVQTPYEWLGELRALADSLGLDFILSVFHPEAVDLAERLKVDAYKIANFELDYHDLIEEVAKTKKDLVISAGSSTYKEISDTVDLVRKYHNKLYLLKCTPEYPAPLEKLNLKTILAMRRAFKCDVGFSDHTDGILAPVVAVSMGARLIEKHIKIDDEGMDSAFSVYPDRFAMMVDCARGAYKAMGEISYTGSTNYKRKLINGKMIRTV